MHPSLVARSISLTRLAAVAIFAFAACGPTTTIEQTWTSPAARIQPPLRTVVTVFFSGNTTIRHAGEDQLARDLMARGVRATPSYLIFHDEELGDLDAVRAKLRGMGYDGVVTMRVVDRYQELEVMPPTFDGYWRFAHPYFSSPWFYPSGYAYTETVVRVETSAYSLRTGRLVWSALTRTYGDSARRLIDDTSRVISSQLIRRGLAG
jgi:hypothetical protein